MASSWRPSARRAKARAASPLLPALLEHALEVAQLPERVDDAGGQIGIEALRLAMSGQRGFVAGPSSGTRARGPRTAPRRCASPRARPQQAHHGLLGAAHLRLELRRRACGPAADAGLSSSARRSASSARAWWVVTRRDVEVLPDHPVRAPEARPGRREPGILRHAPQVEVPRHRAAGHVAGRPRWRAGRTRRRARWPASRQVARSRADAAERARERRDDALRPARPADGRRRPTCDSAVCDQVSVPAGACTSWVETRRRSPERSRVPSRTRSTSS